jgi:hypothetical protein
LGPSGAGTEPGPGRGEKVFGGAASMKTLKKLNQTMLAILFRIISWKRPLNCRLMGLGGGVFGEIVSNGKTFYEF